MSLDYDDLQDSNDDYKEFKDTFINLHIKLVVLARNNETDPDIEIKYAELQDSKGTNNLVQHETIRIPHDLLYSLYDCFEDDFQRADLYQLNIRPWGEPYKDKYGRIIHELVGHINIPIDIIGPHGGHDPNGTITNVDTGTELKKLEPIRSLILKLQGEDILENIQRIADEISEDIVF